MKAIINEQSKKVLSEMATELVRWYRATNRPLPWRQSRDPYRIWISEVMLQQTTVQAVVPYYERFLNELPSLESLAEAKLEKVLELWAGLGYYSRARNLHKAAGMLNAKKSWPKSAEELLQLPGFGPYTSRAVSSLAFGESVGVLDGNVIRVLSRALGVKLQWWKPSERASLQLASDLMSQTEDSYYMNQALMELGATVCTPQSPNCATCPVNKNCVGLKINLVSKLPLKKPKRETEFWIWKPILLRKKSQVALVKNNYAPFLKGQMIFPGVVLKKTERPKTFEQKHSITHHDIYIQPDRKSKAQKTTKTEIKWVEEKNLKQVNPSSLLKKVIELWSVAAIVTGGKQLTFIGENSFPYFSKDGSKVVYQSKDRTLHDNSQIYEMTLSTGKEKRITYSDGQSIKPFYSKDEKEIYYLSDTDLLKEKPSLFAPDQLKDPNTFETELFSIEPSSLKIERISILEKAKNIMASAEKTPAKKLNCTDASIAVSENLKKVIYVKPTKGDKKETQNQLFLYEFESPLENCDIQW